MKNKMFIFAILILIIICIAMGFIYYKNRESEKEMSSSNSTNIIQNNENKNDENEIKTNSMVASSDNTNFNFETRTVKLNSGYEMPLNGIGTYSLTGDTCYNDIKSALNSGVRLIDTAYMYGNEEEIGRAIKDSNVPREEIFVITKIYPSQFDKPEEAIEIFGY